MKRYSMNAVGEARPNALGLWAEYSEVHALLRAVAEEVGKIDLRPWIDCACETCIENGAAHARVLALLEVKS